MKACWRQDPSLRPDFTDICNTLRKILEAASEDYGYLIPISTMASVDSGSQQDDVKVDYV